MLNCNAFPAFLRKHDELIGSHQPGATVAAVCHFVRDEWQSADPIARAIAIAAAKGPHLAPAAKPVLLVVCGDKTARARNFGLDGCSRDTTPGLGACDVVCFPGVSSCGMATAASLPCMVAALTQADWSHQGFLSQKTLPDVRMRAGFKVDWLDKDTSDPRIAQRTGLQPRTGYGLPCSMFRTTANPWVGTVSICASPRAAWLPGNRPGSRWRYGWTRHSRPP